MSTDSRTLKERVLRLEPKALSEVQDRCRAIGWTHREFMAEVRRVFDVAGMAPPDESTIDGILYEYEQEEEAL